MKMVELLETEVLELLETEVLELEVWELWMRKEGMLEMDVWELEMLMRRSLVRTEGRREAKKMRAVEGWTGQLGWILTHFAGGEN